MANNRQKQHLNHYFHLQMNMSVLEEILQSDKAELKIPISQRVLQHRYYVTPPVNIAQYILDNERY